LALSDLPIQPYDIVMLAVLAVATIFGAWKGMAWQVASLASVLVSAFVAMNFSGLLAPWLSDREWARFAAMLILYLLTSLAVWLVFRLVASAIDRVKLKEWDHQVGGLFGFAKGVLLCMVITFFAVTLTESGRQTVLKSRSGRAVAFLIQQGRPLMPQEVDRVVGQYIEQLDKKLDPNSPADEQKPLAGLPGAGDLKLPSGAGPTSPTAAPSTSNKPAQEPGRTTRQESETERLVREFLEKN
jgi:membrane protein required for colicin V production